MGERGSALGRAVVAGVTATVLAACGGSVELGTAGVTGATSSGSGGTTSAGSGGGGQTTGGMAGCVPGAPAVALAPLPLDEEVFQLVVDVTDVYWVAETLGVLRAPKAGGEAVTLPGTADAYELAIDADSLYLCMRPPDEEGPWPLVRTAKDGSGPVTLATGSACNAVAVSGDQVFWAGAGGILRADKATGAGSSVLCATDLTGGFVWELVAGDAGLWWVQVDGDEEGTSSLFAVAQGGGPVTTVDSHNAYQSLAAGGAFMYWNSGFPEGATGLWRAAAPAGAPLLIGSAGQGLATDGDYVYTVTSAGLVKVPASGGAPVVLTSEVEPQGWSLAVDESCVYWLDNTKQALMKIHKGAP